MTEQILKEINYYVYNDVKITEVAQHFNRSISSVKKDFAKFKKYILENPESEHIILYNLLVVRTKSNEILGRKKGSQWNNGGIAKDSTLQKALIYAKYIIKNGSTLPMTSDKFGVPISTIYDEIEKLKDTEYNDIYLVVKKIYKLNRHQSNESVGSKRK